MSRNLLCFVAAFTLCFVTACSRDEVAPSTPDNNASDDAPANADRKPAKFERDLIKELEALPGNVRTVEYAERLDLKDEHLALIATKPEVSLLDLTGCSAISDDQFAVLAALKNLRILRLARTSIGDAALTHLAPVTSLEVLDISYNDEVTDRGVNELAGLAKLEELRLEGCDAITDQALADLAQLKALRHLNLSYCPRISVAGIATVLKGCPNLKELILHHTTVNDDLGEVLGDGTALNKVDLRSCSSLTTAGRADLTSKYPSIRFVLDP